MSFERDEVEILGGVRHGRTLGGPIAIRVGNTEWPKWQVVMSPDPVPADELEGLARNAPLTRPRPGHADLAGMQKYGFDDARPVLERSSARETAARVALGTVAQAFLRQVAGVELLSHVVSIGEAAAPYGSVPTPADRAAVDADPVRCLDPEASAAMVAEIDAARKDGDTLGGVVEVVVHGLPPGLGSHVHWDRRLDSRLAAALMGIQAIKGVEVGDGFDVARRRGSLAHDEIVDEGEGVRRLTGRAGGIEGGMTTGEVLRVRAAMKPISTVPRALAHHRRRDRRGGGGDQPAQRRLCRTRRRRGGRGDGGAGARRRDAREVRRRLGDRDPAQPRGLPRGPGRSGDHDRSAGGCSGRPAWRRQVHGRPGGRQGARGRVPRHRRRRRRSDRPQRLRPLPPRGRGASSAGSRPRPWPRHWPSTMACWRSAGERCSQRRRESCLPATRVVFLDVGLADAVQPGRHGP